MTVRTASLPPAPVPARSPAASFSRDVATVFTREITPSVRDPLGLLFTMAQPLLLLFFFGPLLGGVGAGGGGGSWQWFVPGVLVMLTLFGPMMAGYNLLVELLGGAMERMLVSPMNRTAMLIGRTLKEFAVLLVQAVLIVLLAVPMGFELYPLGLLAGLLLLAVFGVGLGSLSFLLAMKSAPSGELFYGVTQLAVFPLMLLSGVLLPMDFGPQWLQTVAMVNPVTHIADAMRALFTGSFTDPSIAWGALSAAAVAAVGLTFGTRAMRKGVGV
ncbi:ABC transporter permease [Nocardiopsis suaedae]|uniref:Transport permease protein n=1 Tax=Nocardiopsis suaedae TaxID=3018444 RepID=A0ABT4TG42_9ACTN|nr:ABC transporter permease [Nocardiopsis suaedae]MDA2803678.1 ABC transporter permease [Nocardiopsis suaedae]